MIFARIDPDALQVAGWLASLFFVAGGTNQILKLVDRAREKPPPAQTYVARVDCRRCQDEQAARAARLEADRRQLRLELKADLGRVHRRLDDLAADVNRQLAALPHDLIATLKNTGAIP